MDARLRALVAAAAACLLLTAAVHTQNTAAATIWDGVYSEAQASKGAEVYAAKCAACHGASLEGADVAPPLVGEQFSGTWSGTMLSDLFDRIRTTMPADAPGTLNRQQVVDVLGHLLKSGKFPAGTAPLEPDPAALSRIRFEGLRPQSK
jgi:S-disulfanyl-L-cysteine oxidoreductase SoxD